LKIFGLLNAKLMVGWKNVFSFARQGGFAETLVAKNNNTINNYTLNRVDLVYYFYRIKLPTKWGSRTWLRPQE